MLACLLKSYSWMISAIRLRHRLTSYRHSSICKCKARLSIMTWSSCLTSCMPRLISTKSRSLSMTWRLRWSHRSHLSRKTSRKRTSRRRQKLTCPLKSRSSQTKSFSKRSDRLKINWPSLQTNLTKSWSTAISLLSNTKQVSGMTSSLCYSQSKKTRSRRTNCASP